MLIIDDNKMKLLRMKEKLLEVSTDNIDYALADYREVITDIDNIAYNGLIEEINKVDYSSLSLEEQIEYFNQIIDDYTYLNELQCGFKNLYQKYSFEDIELSDISVIAIDDIRERVSAIQGYLMNSKNLQNNKLELDNLNTDYIIANKKNNSIVGQINMAEDNLKNEILLAEGRIQSVNGDMEYTSVSDEFKVFDLDLKELLNDNELLNDIYNITKNEYKDSEETLSVALLCYKNGNGGDIDVCERIRIDTLKSKYKLILVSIIKEICNKNNQCDLIKNKLNKLLDLIKERKKVLQELNIRHFIDPFDRININKYMEVINILEDNMDEIKSLTKTITYFMSVIEEMSEENKELLNKINSKLVIINEKDEMVVYNNSVGISIDDSYDNSVTYQMYDNDLDSLIKVADADNQVIKISDISDNFLLERVYEKANGVIKRVNDVLSMKQLSDDINHYEVSPKLVVDSVSIDNNDSIKQDVSIDLFSDDLENVFVDDSKESDDEVTNNIFVDNSADAFNDENADSNNKINEEVKTDNIFLDKTEDIEAETKIEDEVVLDNPFLDTSSDDVTINSESSNGDSIFEEVEPFEVTPLFNDRYDDEIFEGNANEKLEDTMPEIFWNVPEKVEKETDTQEENNVLSFDEQIEELMGDSKTRRKVA